MKEQNSMFNTIEEAINDIRNGKMVIVVDNEDRENEGDLIMSSQLITDQDVNFMVKHARGLICMPVSTDYARQMKLEPMVHDNEDPYRTAFTVSIDHIDSTTGISAQERAYTLQQAALNPEANKFTKPGHIFPLIAKSGGVIERPGHTEASIDLMKLAGLNEVATICEILNDDGTMKRRDDLFVYAKKHGLTMITIESLVNYLKQKEQEMSKVTTAMLPTKYGTFSIHGFVNKKTAQEHIALTIGDYTNNPLVRVHSECLTGDAFGSLKCDCGDQYAKAMTDIAKEPGGILIYLRQEGRGIGLVNKLRAYHLQDQGFDTVEANEMLGFQDDERSYKEAAEMLKILDVKSVRLLTNNPLKIEGLEQWGITVSERVHIEPNHNEYNQYYMKTKKKRMNHILKGDF